MQYLYGISLIIFSMKAPVLPAFFLGCSSTEIYSTFYARKLTLNLTLCQRECRTMGFPFASFRFISNPCGCGRDPPESLRETHDSYHCTALEWSLGYTVEKVKDCPRNFTRISRKPYDVCLSLVHPSLNFDMCRRECVLVNGDIFSDIDANVLRKKMLSNKGNQVEKKSVAWVGLHKESKYEDFHWLSKYEKRFSSKEFENHWNFGYPGSQKCIVFLPDEGLWETKRCRQSHACICQVTLDHSTYVRFRDGILGIYDRIVHFFSNKQNIAMYLVLPIMVMSICSCCVIYGCAKMVENYKLKKKQRRKMKRKQKRNQVSPDFTEIPGSSHTCTSHDCNHMSFEEASIQPDASLSSVEYEANPDESLGEYIEMDINLPGSIYTECSD